MVSHSAHDPWVMGSKPALATIEESILGHGANTNCGSLHQGVYMGTWPVIMSAAWGCTLAYAVKPSDQGVGCRVGSGAFGQI